ncbi:MAG: hypothetical protein DSZ29_00795 [Aquificaceae bacterium]|nr:MAG: hypothetical protein DSZ29_00795 [Aquificaceae bacterium]
MLIYSLQLTNFKKYTTLTIDDIPEQGVIKVGGQNESGKTSIGEAVCFALFGRTFLNDKKNAKRLIHWGEREMSVSIVLKDESDTHFEISRTINDNALSSIRIVRLSDNHILTNSLSESEQIISDLLGYDYDTFVDSFCMVQRELTAPDVSSIKQMAGIGDYGDITDELVMERTEETHSLNALKPPYDEKSSALQAIDLDESWLPELVEANETLLGNQKGKQQLIGQLGEMNATYPDSSQRYKKLKKYHNIFEWLGVFLLPLMIGTWLVWGVFQFFPEIIQNWLPANTSSDHVDAFMVWVQTWMFPVAMGTVLIYGISLFFKWRAESRIAVLKDQGLEFSTILQQGHQHVIDEVDKIVPTRVGQSLLQQLQENTSTSAELTVSPATEFSHIPKLGELTAHYAATPSELNDAVDHLQNTLHTQSNEIDQHLSSLGNDIEQEKERSDRAGELRAGLQKISQTMKKHETNIKIRDYSIKMLQRASSKSIAHFNQSITDFAAKSLPHFTENRYKQIKMNDDLSVEVFSDEKQDFIAYDEISSGTQRQIMLALRMGMSEQLAINTGNTKQFVFLDEPFAFFDHQRTISTLEALPEVSDVVSQIWVTSQEFPEELTLNS